MKIKDLIKELESLGNKEAEVIFKLVPDTPEAEDTDELDEELKYLGPIGTACVDSGRPFVEMGLQNTGRKLQNYKLTKDQLKAIKKPCPICKEGKLYPVAGDRDQEIPEDYLWCDNCDMSMDGDGGCV